MTEGQKQIMKHIKENFMMGEIHYTQTMQDSIIVKDKKGESLEFYLEDGAVKSREPLADKKRLFIDMDGTLAVFTPVDRLETLYQPGYFYDLKPITNVVQGVKEFIRSNPEVDVYILSSVLSDSSYAVSEKNQWLDKYLPEIPETRRFFPPCGIPKRDAMPNGITGTDFLMDDFTKNLSEWQPPGVGIKLLNGINHTKGTWISSCITYEKPPEIIAAAIKSVMEGSMVRDKKPVYQIKNTRKVR